MSSFCLASAWQSRVDSSRSPCFFDHEYDPFLGKGISVGYRIGGSVPGTAVVRIYTDDCFVVAADGLRLSFHGRQVVNDKQQKIFVIEQSAGLFAHALTGVTYFEHGRTTFSVSDAVQKIANELLMEHFTSADRYIARFGKLAIDALRKGQRDGKIKGFEDISGNEPGLIVTILFAGYFKTKAFMADIKLFHHKQKLQTPAFEFKDCIPGEVEIKVAGSTVVFNELRNTDNPDFTRFRSAGFRQIRNEHALSELDAVELARNYIAACADPKGRELAPECVGIGGHTYIVSVKRGDFKWVDPPA